MKKITIFCNKSMMVLYYIALCFFTIGFPAMLTYFAVVFPYKQDKILCIGMILFFYAFAFLLSYVCLPTIGVKLVLSEKGVEVKIPFRKNIFHEWSFYCYCEKAYYPYYGIPSYYIVLSNFKLRTDELAQINNVQFSDKCMRIKYNKKNYDALVEMLPQKLSSSLKNQFANITAPKVNIVP